MNFQMSDFKDPKWQQILLEQVSTNLAFEPLKQKLTEAQSNSETWKFSGNSFFHTTILPDLVADFNNQITKLSSHPMTQKNRKMVRFEDHPPLEILETVEEDQEEIQDLQYDRQLSKALLMDMYEKVCDQVEDDHDEHHTYHGSHGSHDDRDECDDEACVADLVDSNVSSKTTVYPVQTLALTTCHQEPERVILGEITSQEEGKWIKLGKQWVFDSQETTVILKAGCFKRTFLH